MKKKIYYFILLITCLSIATPAMATPMFGETAEPVEKIYVGDDGNCYQKYRFASHFLWIEYNVEVKPVEVPCVQISYRSLGYYQ